MAIRMVRGRGPGRKGGGRGGEMGRHTWAPVGRDCSRAVMMSKLDV